MNKGYTIKRYVKKNKEWKIIKEDNDYMVILNKYNELIKSNRYYYKLIDNRINKTIYIFVPKKYDKDNKNEYIEY